LTRARHRSYRWGMASDHWKTRAKGGRRAFLKVWLLGAAGWVGVGLRNTALTVLLMQAWNAITAPRRKLTVVDSLAVTDPVNIQLGPLTLSASGTVSDPPAQIA
jgi:hypothetical protein